MPCQQKIEIPGIFFILFFGWLKLVIWLNQNSKWLKKLCFGGFSSRLFPEDENHLIAVLHS
jgi:hypothetical protein